ncbi:hypothetical protein [uncultured Maribacter sp.]|uniref:hypothetical protein n=1 Tax=uncultured Maribacter sp. TaxID=431308 RepID=UPI00262F6BDA|nr:hypothetical protein [uncultured Maribacter sp.]
MEYVKPKFLILAIATLILTSCTSEAKNNERVLEVTTFNLKTTAIALEFNALDAEIENTFTSKQPGYIRRQSGVDAQGKYVVLVYWKTIADAKASMDKFMKDASVTNYVSMIESESMKMSRYTIKDTFTAPTSNFTELMTFKTKEGINLADFNKTNKKVETNFTVKQKGFLQRIIGSNEKGEQVVLVYWDTKENSNAVINDFMSAPIAKEFMGMMDQPTINMVRYESITSLKNVTLSNKDKVVALLNSFNTGDYTPVSYINPKKYIQHNLGVADGLEGFGALMQHAP